MVTLAGLEPATSPGPRREQGRSIPLELQRRYDPHDDLWRRKGGHPGLKKRARPKAPPSLYPYLARHIVSVVPVDVTGSR
jgi:hypothetical protein